MSSTYILPTVVSVDGDDLQDVIHDFIVGITGLPAPFVRPRWQPSPPTVPSANTDWCAVGFTNIGPTSYPYTEQRFYGSVLFFQEELDFLATFYGPNASKYSNIVRLGVYVPDNRQVLDSYGIKLTDVGAASNVPELINSQFIDRVDLPIVFSRLYQTIYPIQSVLSVTAGLKNPNYANPPISLTQQILTQQQRTVVVPQAVLAPGQNLSWLPRSANIPNDYYLDIAAYLAVNCDTVADFDVNIFPPPTNNGDLYYLKPQAYGNLLNIWIAGGIPGVTYSLIFNIVTKSGATVQYSVGMLVTS